MTKSLSPKSGDTGGIKLIKKNTIISLLLVFLCTGLSLGQDGNETGGAANATIADAAADQANESTNGSINESSSLPGQNATNLNYIWSFSNIEAGPITMVINQDGSELLGQAKYEPDAGAAWNADVFGSVSGDEVSLTMTAQKDGMLLTTRMTGTYASDAITGNWTQSSGGKKLGNGTFMAMWISPDTSSYKPAVIEQPKAETTAPAEETAAQTESAENTSTETTSSKSRFVDVRQYKDKIGPGGDLSGVPPGMGGSGL
jgi:hypothetical protein